MEKENEPRLLNRALTIMEAVSNQSTPIGVNQISELVGLSPSTAFRILQTLAGRGWLNQDENGKYSIGLEIYLLGNKFDFVSNLKELSYYYMKELSLLTEQASNLIVRKHDKCVIIQQTRSSRLVDMVAPVGTELPLHASAGGKIFLSELPQVILDQVLKENEFRKYTEHTITDKKRLLDELAEIRQRGYALDNGESTSGARCISLPIRSHEKKIVATISLSGITKEFDSNDIEYYYGNLKKVADAIMEGLYKSY